MSAGLNAFFKSLASVFGSKDKVETEAPAVMNKDLCNTSVPELVNVDERTAAMIMAIVSHESRIPLSELNFKYIKAVS